jgi:hypothetical protein
MKKLILILGIVAFVACKKDEVKPEELRWRCVFAVNKSTNKREYVGCCIYGPTLSASISAKLDNYYKGPEESFVTSDSASCKNF